MPYQHNRFLLPLFAAPLGLAALLLFWLQPMIAKMLLPDLGGAPAVWNVAMVFFQGILLLGYLYATLVTTRLSPKIQVLVHAGLLLTAFIFLPLALEGGDATEAILNPIHWLLRTLALSVGMLALVCAATSPLLQYWFGRCSTSHGENPYFLYAISNAGSFAGLIGYVAILEPWLSLEVQAEWWSHAFLLLLILEALCLIAVWRNAKAQAVPEAAGVPTPAAALPITNRTRLNWLLLSFTPSALLLALTLYLTTDIAPLPLLWIVPLGLYLLAYIFAFIPRWHAKLGGENPIAKLLPLQLMIVAPLMVGFYTGIFNHAGGMLILVWHCLAFFVTALVCHRRLYEIRPPASQLPSYYFYLSLGGVLGGMFTALAVPHLLKDTLEYPLLLALALALRPGTYDAWKRSLLWPLGVFVGLGAVAFLGGWLLRISDNGLGMPVTGFLLGVSVLALKACFEMKDRPLALGLCFAAGIASGIIWDASRENILYRGRNFFGALAVTGQMNKETKEEHRYLLHGTTIHGIERRGHPEPLGYFFRGSGLSEVFDALHARIPALKVGVMGLGIGSIKCLANAGDHLTYYEINPLVVDVAEDPAYFTLLANCPGTHEIHLGDGRLQLAHDPEARFDLLIMDAFNSDSVPVHLITAEALSMYRKHLNPGGLIVFHISNRYLDLSKVVGSLAAGEGLEARLRYSSGSLWTVLADDPALLAPFTEEKGWKPLPDFGPATRWTDHFSNVIRIFNPLGIDPERH